MFNLQIIQQFHNYNAIDTVHVNETVGWNVP